MHMYPLIKVEKGAWKTKDNKHGARTKERSAAAAAAAVDRLFSLFHYVLKEAEIDPEIGILKYLNPFLMIPFP